MLSKRLYRLLLKSGKQILEPQNKMFLVSTLTVFETSILQLSEGKKLLHRLKKNPTKALGAAFRTGTIEDIDRLISMLPKLNRYFRACRLLDQFAKSVQPYSYGNLLQTEYDIGKGAILISKLQNTDMHLKLRDVEKQFDLALKSMVLDLKIEIKNVIQEEGDLYENCDNITVDHNWEEMQRSRVFAIVIALDRLIKKREQKRLRSLENRYVHFVDQVLEEGSIDYLRATPIVYSTIYCTLINYLGIEVEAFGVSNPKHFLSRLALKVLKNTHEEKPLPFVKFVEGRIPPYRGRISFAHVKDMSIGSFSGFWMRISDGTFSSCKVIFDRSTSTLRVFSGGSSRRLIWQLEVTDNSQRANQIKIGVDYFGEYFQNVDGFEKMIPCTIKFSALSPDLFGSCRESSFQANGIYLEIEVSYKDSMSLRKSEGSATNIVESVEFIERYCRMSDVDLCLFDFSDQGVTPITPVNYLEYLKK